MKPCTAWIKAARKKGKQMATTITIKSNCRSISSSPISTKLSYKPLSRHPDMCGLTKKKRQPNRSGRRMPRRFCIVWVEIYFAYCMFFLSSDKNKCLFLGLLVCGWVWNQLHKLVLSNLLFRFYFFHIKIFHSKMVGSKNDDKKI